MTRTVKKIIAENNDKRELLSTGNKAYYEDFLTYTRSTFLKDERSREEVLLEMLDHLLLAQKDGKSAEAVFGKNPKELADDIIENLPTEPFKYVFTFGLELIATLLACYTIVVGIMDMITSQEKTIYLGNALIVVGTSLATLAVLIYVIFYYLKKESFEKKKSKSLYVYSTLILLVGSFSPILLMKTLSPIGQEIELGRYGMFSIGCLLTLVTFLMKKIREQR